MRRIGFVLGLLMVVSKAPAQERVCFNEVAAQTRAKISEHYANQNIEANLATIKTFELSDVVSNGPALKGNQYESVKYSSYTMIGHLVIGGKDQASDSAFYVRFGILNCDVLKVALLRSGASPDLKSDSTQSEDQQDEEMDTASRIETPGDGSPKIGYTYVGQGEKSQLVENRNYLSFLQKRAERLVKRF